MIGRMPSPIVTTSRTAILAQSHVVAKESKVEATTAAAPQPTVQPLHTVGRRPFSLALASSVRKSAAYTLARFLLPRAADKTFG